MSQIAVRRAAAAVFVAEHGADVVGFACGTMLKEPEHGLDAELAAVYLCREFQHPGLGRRLVGAVVDAQRAHNALGLLTWAIAGNKGARSFYETLGGELAALAAACRAEAFEAKH